MRADQRVAALLIRQPDEAIRRAAYDQQPYWDIERARIGNTREMPVEIVVNGKAVARQTVPPTAKCGS